MDMQQGIKYMISKSLRDLTRGLNPAEFYRINKKYLIHINSIRKYKLCVAGRIEVELYPATKEKVFINQLKMQDFKKWVTMGITTVEDHFVDNIFQGQLLNVGE